ncbi:uncharacterized protein F4812DRAFT_65292 [Daldinia caldariorum]|uniref:uncharacterized protein n=1 Tax=Daldinia caldariorum TaxID=326644 RepID=UPI002008E9BB|nr:uncharacterized protein F4812DRAFT_65292 [Daldinia caldariorum]KAI1466765.1 hypothetical protein F4812DRAFT_65292 [Daldinia caldariorum]
MVSAFFLSWHQDQAFTSLFCFIFLFSSQGSARLKRPRRLIRTRFTNETAVIFRPRARSFARSHSGTQREYNGMTDQ